MANFVISYDLNGPSPSHEQMDKHLQKLGGARGRILETVWYVGYSGTLDNLLTYVRQIVSSNDLLFVVECKEATWTKLLVSDDGLTKSWKDNR